MADAPAPAQPVPRRIVILSAPSGAGKTTILHAALARLPYLAFSVSATTRPRRPHEVHGRDYYFLSEDDFRRRLDAGEFLEWQEVYPGRFYGTLHSEIDRIVATGQVPVFEVDVQGGMHLKMHFGTDALACFIEPPSVHALRERLQARATEHPDEIERRVGKALAELEFAEQFDVVVVNQDLETAIASVAAYIDAFVRTGALPPQPLAAARHP